MFFFLILCFILFALCESMSKNLLQKAFQSNFKTIKLPAMFPNLALWANTFQTFVATEASSHPFCVYNKSNAINSIPCSKTTLTASIINLHVIGQISFLTVINGRAQVFVGTRCPIVTRQLQAEPVARFIIEHRNTTVVHLY